MPLPAGYHYAPGSAGRDVITPDGEIISKRQAYNIAARQEGWSSYAQFSSRGGDRLYRALATAANATPDERRSLTSEFNRIASAVVGIKDPKDPTAKARFAQALEDLGLSGQSAAWRQAWRSYYRTGGDA
jgi:hypothetical protein